MPDKHGLTPLHHAAARGDAGLFTLLLQGRAWAVIEPHSMACGPCCSKGGCAEFAEQQQRCKRPKAQQLQQEEEESSPAAGLLDAPLDNPAGALSARRLLLCAAYGGDPSIVEQVLDGGARSLDTGQKQGARGGAAASALHVAALKGQAHVAALLLQHGYSACGQGLCGLTPLHLSALGAAKVAPRPGSATPGGNLALQAGPALGVELMPWLWHPASPDRQHGCAPEQQHAGGEQQEGWQLRCAGKQQHEEVCQVLVAAGADVLAEDDAGRTVAMCAAGGTIHLACCLVKCVHAHARKHSTHWRMHALAPCLRFCAWGSSLPSNLWSVVGPIHHHL